MKPTILIQAPRIILWNVLWGSFHLALGLWMLFRHPIQFMQFAELYLEFAGKIEENNDLAASGYYNLNRRQRRKLERQVR